MGARSILLLLAASALASSSPAGAADRPIEVRIPDCPSAPLSLDGFLSSLRVELAGRDPPCCALASPAAGARDGEAIPMRVTLSIEPCDAGTDMIEIHVRDSLRGTTVDRQVVLRDIASDARPRALALLVAEMVRAASQTQPPPAALPQSSGSDRVVILSGAFEFRAHPNRNMTLWGFRPAIEAVRGHWQAAVDLEAARADPSVSLGDVSTDLLSATAEMGPRFHLRHFALDVGACGSLGWVWMGGHTNDPSNVPSSGSAFVASAGTRLAIDLPARPQHPNVRALIEAGAMIHGADATVNGNSAASLTGVYLLAGLGFGVEWIR